MPDTALGSKGSRANKTDKVLPAWSSSPSGDTQQTVKKSINKQSSIMKDTTNKMKFNDVVENDEWRRQIQNFM